MGNNAVGSSYKSIFRYSLHFYKYLIDKTIYWQEKIWIQVWFQTGLEHIGVGTVFAAPPSEPHGRY